MAAQATAYENMMEGWPKWATAYNVLMSGDEGMSTHKHERAMHKLCGKGEKAWLDTNSVIFDHQLEFYTKLIGFLCDVYIHGTRSQLELK